MLYILVVGLAFEIQYKTSHSVIILYLKAGEGFECSREELGL